MKRLPLHWKIVIGLVLGIGVGVVLNVLWTDSTWKALGVGNPAAFLKGAEDSQNAAAGFAADAARFTINLTQTAGSLFIRLLRFIAVPVVLFSLIAGTASIGDVRKLGRIGGKTLSIFAVTTVVSVLIGIGLTRTVRPGDFVGEETKAQLIADRASEAASKAESGRQTIRQKTGWERLLEIVPLNPFEALARAEMLQIVFVAMFVGAALTVLPASRSSPIVSFCEGMTDAITVLIGWVMKIAPVAVFCILAPIIATVGLDVLGALAIYSVVVVAGLATILFALYPIMLRLFTKPGNRVTFMRFFKAMAPAQLLAFSSSSSNATLPVNMQCARERLGVGEEVTSFVLPLGATINMNGTALYQAVIAIFLSQLYDIPLSLSDQLTLVAMATLAAIGSAGIPGSSIALLVFTLETVHVPPEGIAIVLGMDRLLDMCRTVVNTSGDAATAAIIAASEGKLRTEAEVG